jgi:hypothetical protein
MTPRWRITLVLCLWAMCTVQGALATDAPAMSMRLRFVGTILDMPEGSVYQVEDLDTALPWMVWVPAAVQATLGGPTVECTVHHAADPGSRSRTGLSYLIAVRVVQAT